MTIDEDVVKVSPEIEHRLYDDTNENSSDDNNEDDDDDEINDDKDDGDNDDGSSHEGEILVIRRWPRR